MVRVETSWVLTVATTEATRGRESASGMSKLTNVPLLPVVRFPAAAASAAKAVGRAKSADERMVDVCAQANI